MIVCTFCGVHKDATLEDALCALRGPTAMHVWGDIVPPPSIRQKSAERAIVRHSATVASVVVVVGFILFAYWTEILKAGTFAVAAALGIMEWVASWPWSAWICISILWGSGRVARAIKQHGEKAEK